MSQEIKPINLGGLMGLGANCYLVKTGIGYILIDTGFSTKRTDLEKELEKADCKSGNLQLIVITHGHGDHIGNCVYLREKYGTKIAMHPGDAKIAEGEHVSNHILDIIILKILAFNRSNPVTTNKIAISQFKIDFAARLVGGDIKHFFLLFLSSEL